MLPFRYHERAHLGDFRHLSPLKATYHRVYRLLACRDQGLGGRKHQRSVYTVAAEILPQPLVHPVHAGDFVRPDTLATLPTHRVDFNLVI